MRSTLLAALVLVALAAPGCGGGEGGGADGGADAHPPDVGSGPDAAPRDTGATPDAGPSDAAPRDGDPPLPVPTGCPDLGPSEGTEVRLGPDRVGELPDLVRTAAPGTTFVLEDGTYALPAILQVTAPGTTIRSASDDAARVVLDGAYAVPELLQVTARDVTIAHLTLAHAVDHAVHVIAPDGGPDVTGFRLYGAVLVDHGEQFVKVNSGAAKDAFVDDGRVECSAFELTDAGRPHIERNPGGCYTGGIDAHMARGWVVRQNDFRGIYCAGEGLAEHAVHFWQGSRDTLVENNAIFDCARGIGFGLLESGNRRVYDDDPGVGHLGHIDGIIRGNVLFATIPYYDTGIELDQARGARVHHNTVVSTDAATGFFSSIDYRFANTDVTLRNNLVRRITSRNGASGTVDHNLEGASLDLFVDAPGHDLHLRADATAAIDQGIPVEDAGLDLDGDARDLGAAPDLGADERVP